MVSSAIGVGEHAGDFATRGARDRTSAPTQFGDPTPLPVRRISSYRWTEWDPHMSGSNALPPPPPATYPTAPSPNPSGGVKLPGGLTLWDLIGFLIILVGAILILVGFLLGDAAYAALSSSPPSPSTSQNDIEGFFLWAGFGIFLTILGWLCRAMLFPILVARKRSAPVPYAAPAPTMAPAPVAAAPATPAPVAPAAVPAAPACANCGRPTTYVAQYSRYYCYSCSRYV